MSSRVKWMSLFRLRHRNLLGTIFTPSPFGLAADKQSSNDTSLWGLRQCRNGGGGTLLSRRFWSSSHPIEVSTSLLSLFHRGFLLPCPTPRWQQAYSVYFCAWWHAMGCACAATTVFDWNWSEAGLTSCSRSPSSNRSIRGWISSSCCKKFRPPPSLDLVHT